jgi:2-polyprenyl-3-methyl-5-hydroxy-6-metoxy-1,4-benzoquinol methylase
VSSRYQADVDLGNANNSQTVIVELVGSDKVVLDVGCAAGDTALALAEAGCRVSGVDIEDAVPDERRDLFQKFLVADIEKTPLTTLFEPGSFDAVIFGDVLEHLVNPEASLADAVQLLSPDGHVVVSIPNVAHGAVRLALLEGRWTYTDKGLLDSTHLRFFTRETACDLLEGAGLVIEELHATILDPFDAEVEFDPSRIPPTVIEWVRHQPDAMNFQYVATARLLREGETRPERPRLQATLSPARARHDDEHRRAADAERDERHNSLITRDHIIGLEAQTAAALSRQRAAEDKMVRLNTRARRLRDHLDGLIEEIDRLPSWKGSKKLRELGHEARPPRGRDA